MTDQLKAQMREQGRRINDLDCAISLGLTTGYVIIPGWLTKVEVAVLPQYSEEVTAMKDGTSAPGMT